MRHRILIHCNRIPWIAWRRLLSRYCMSLCIGWLACGIALATPLASPKIEIGFPEFAPYSFTNQEGLPDGYLIRLTTALFEKIGLREQSVVIYPASRLFKGLRNGSIDFSMLVHNPALDACCLFSKEAVVREQLLSYRLADKPAINNKLDLRGKRIITIHGYSYAGLIDFINDEKNHISNEVASSHAAAFAMLAAGRADYVLDYAGPSTISLRARPVAQLRFDVIDTLDIFLVLSNAYPDAKNIMPRMMPIVKMLQQEPDFLPPISAQAMQAGDLKKSPPSIAPMPD